VTAVQCDRRGPHIFFRTAPTFPSFASALEVRHILIIQKIWALGSPALHKFAISLSTRLGLVAVVRFGYGYKGIFSLITASRNGLWEPHSILT